MNCENLNRAELTSCKGLVRIGSRAFCNCTALEEIQLSTCILLQRIERGTFAACSKLKIVELPKGGGGDGGRL